ncbi:maleylacetate reductase [Flexivirga sp. ID2601S]|uniref:Maleylacetate reductase n=1 Tax=Flexivirga aerilata TaxID=1656889 RepID=A0A849ABY9_9MICO|nr:maleylacetate reductase [Flexivirga aerilata]NNG38045.1 maleylacetate reductase [Flexivirga aerilata]
MTTGFTHETLGQRVVFAPAGAAGAVAAEVGRRDARRVMLIAAPAERRLAEQVAGDVPVVAVHDDVRMHVPVEHAQRARAAATEARADLVLSVGGGSTTGLAKAVALTTGLPIVAVPTTYAGSEATPVWGLTSGHEKQTGVDPRVLPASIVYDAALTTSLPVDLSVASGLNAMAHCVDAMWAPHADPLDIALATEGARALATGLPEVVADPGGLDGRQDTLFGAYLAAVAFASAGSGLHHKLCHVLGGRYDLPHAQTHAVVLPHVLALNAPHAPDADRRLAAAFGSDTALGGLEALRTTLDAPRALRDLGMRESDLPGAVAAILPVVPPSNPTPVTEDTMTGLLRRAWEGAPPR